MEIPKHYNSASVEDKWYGKWMEAGYFKSVPDEREPYCMVIPPPNVTGVLHMGHMLNNSIQDILVRKARMEGKNACWVPGIDHASIATEAKVVAKLKEEGVDKASLTREEFLEKAWEWKEKHGGIILEQLKKLGASCDWDRTRFTMDDNLSEAVIQVFVDLYDKGFIYRGIRMVNWDPKGQTALSDEEVIHREVNAKLYYVEYEIEGEDDKVTIATTRPETILGDTGICVHPKDDRYKKYKGKNAIVPLIGRKIPFVFDEYVDMDFGTGALKVTPAHDINDYALGNKHQLESIEIFNDNGTLNENAQVHVGKDRDEARALIVNDLKRTKCLVKEEEISHSVGFSERTDAVIEPKLSMQWFCDMKQLTGPALENVMNGNIQFYPAKFKNTYKHWMENVRDWCISRQLWWGQRIPAWYDPDGNIIVAENQNKAEEIYKTRYPNKSVEKLKQDEDVLDTWFSSWLWPISVFDGITDPDNSDIAYYYPTNDLVTAPEILFFWVARMIMAGYEYKGELPFKSVYLTGIVRDNQRRKMSKSLGNSPDPLELIEKYSADGVRVGMLFCSPAGNDLLFKEDLCKQGRNFCNKLWNASRLIRGWTVTDSKLQVRENVEGIIWFSAKLDKSIEIIEDHFSKYRISDALMVIYKLIWDDFCSWYLEIIKPGPGVDLDTKTYESTIEFLETILKLLHPFMPFITEELWHLIAKKDREDCIMVSTWPETKGHKQDILSSFEMAMEIVSSIRNIRKEKQLSSKESLELISKENISEGQWDGVISKLANLSGITYSENKPEKAQAFLVKSNEFFIPFDGLLDPAEETRKIQGELEYTKGFLKSIMKKLDNQNFTSNAPAKVVELERKKQTDAEAKIKALELQLDSF